MMIYMLCHHGNTYAGVAISSLMKRENEAYSSYSIPFLLSLNTMNKVHPVIIIACLVIITAGMKVSAPVLNPILLAALFAISLVPLVAWLLRKGLKQGPAIALSILIVAVGGLFMIGILGAALTRLIQNMPVYGERLSVLLKGLMDFLHARGIDMSDIRSLEALSPSNMAKLALTLIGDVVALFGNAVLVLLLVIFFLIEFIRLRVNVDSGILSSDTWLAKIAGLGGEIRAYVSITAFTGFLTAIGNIILLLILGVDFPILWGFISFLTNFIPNIGFFIALIPPVFLALIESGGMYALIVVVGYFVINAIAENVIKPKFMGKELSMSILLIFLSLIFWGWVLGPVGAILAIPLTIALRKILEIMSPQFSGTSVEPAPENSQEA
jgi:predicted PurR-regulated permease PerM